jgi:hypothetical protein
MISLGMCYDDISFVDKIVLGLMDVIYSSCGLPSIKF